ncbi:MAG: COX15/CtaA family protein, partial [Flavobacteriaceae bacterium]|nr:COX15/CtaA family protein [Flavobacteriaceae bacterium]
LVLLLLGAFQGFLGWYMVKSGLIDRPDVSHYRLAAHLTTAFLTFAFTLWVALDLIFPTQRTNKSPISKLLIVTTVVLLIQIIYGAFVAGLDAGFIHNHWPLMSEGQFIHPTVYIEQNPVWKNFVEGKSGVQFVHRTLAYIVVFLIGLIWFKTRKMVLDKTQALGVNALIILVFLQFILGVLTLLWAVPVWLGVVHQIGAFFLLSAMTFTLHRFIR